MLAGHLSQMLPSSGSVLDVGCGDGRLGSRLMELNPELRVEGVEVAVRPDTSLTVVPFDGQTLPFPDRSFDCVILVDVLHHTLTPEVLLREARRTARGRVVIKDHTLRGLVSRAILTFMDWVGNRRYKVPLPNNYWTQPQWEKAFQELGLTVTEWRPELSLYPLPWDLIFGRGLHFMASLSHGET